ncbi:MAG: iron-sulfur cluster assembly scaffold protein [bacterium]|nr:iron-sulfur cluster assembly scaffold protein [bacterium]
MYSQEYMKHFQNPQNIGDLDDADAVEEVQFQGQGCFDRIRIFAKLDGNKLKKITYRTRGCSGTIASCSAMSTMAAGMELDQAAQISGDDIAGTLGGVPERKMHSVNLAAEALRKVSETLLKRNG